MSDRHAAALHAHLRRTGNADHSAPANPQRFIENASPDILDEHLSSARRAAARNAAPARTPATRDVLDGRTTPRTAKELTEHLQRSDAEAETAYERKLAERGRSNRGRPGSRGAFDKLRSKVREHLSSTGSGGEPMTKAQPVEHNQSFESRYGCAAYVAEPGTIQRAAVAKVAAPAAAKPSIASIRKSLANIAKSLGNTTLAKSLEAGYGTNSATLTGGSAIRKQSLPAKPAAKPLSPDELLKAASKLLHHGRIDTQTAARVQSEVNLTGKVSPALMKTLGEACK
jgi:hypothetical protein